MSIHSTLTRSIIVLFSATSAFTVSAQVTETSTITNSFTYNLAGQAGSGTNNGGTVEIAKRAETSTGVSEMFLSLNGTLDQGSFLFLHNGTCVGVCSLTMQTDISFSLFNGGPDPVALRFDSQITPGHLANSFLNPLSQSQATYDFQVAQDPGLRQGLIYRSTGDAVRSPPEVFTSDGQPFAGLTLDENTPEWSVLDWSATDLSLGLAFIAPGETSNLYYRSTLTIATSQLDCLNPTLCESFQVAFGDPRNAGAILSASSLRSFASLFSTPTGDDNVINPAVGAPYDPFRVTYRFVPLSTPLLSPPPVFAPIEYDVNYLSPSAVPEPGTWLMLIVGFGMIGAMLRRRRSRTLFAI